MNQPRDEENEFKSGMTGEDAILTFLFGILLVGVLGILYVDFRSLTRSEISFDLPFVQPAVDRAPILPARENDQVRRYSPQVRVDFGPGGRAKLPGVAGNPDKLLSGSMTFHDAGDGVVSAVGLIDPGTFERFRDFLTEIGQETEIKTIYLHSPGGFVQDAISMSRYIRSRELKTVITKHGYCASSCPLVLSGGKTREVVQPSAVGVHQVFASETAVGTLQKGIADAQIVSADAQQLLVDMGVDPRAWIKAMMTPKDKLYLFTEEEVKDFKLSTED